MVYPIYYGSAVAVTRDRAEWETRLIDPSLAPLPALHNDRSTVLTWCHQFAQLEPEEVGLVLMNYFEYDRTKKHKQPTWHYPAYPNIAFLDWYQLRRAITDKTLVCAGYAQLFYLIVRERYPSVRYITSDEINHARNYFADEGSHRDITVHWDITWLDNAGVDYNPDYIKFDYMGMQTKIANGLYGGGRGVGRDWIIVNLSKGERP
jgi:hypothetical protein